MSSTVGTEKLIEKRIKRILRERGYDEAKKWAYLHKQVRIFKRIAKNLAVLGGKKWRTRRQ